MVRELAKDLLDAGALRVREATRADRLDHLVRRRVAHLLPGRKSLAKPRVGDVPVGVVGVLGQHRADELRDRMAVRVVHRAAVELAQPVPDRPDSALWGALPTGFGHGPSIWRPSGCGLKVPSVGGRRTPVTISRNLPVPPLVQSLGSRLPHGWRDLFRQIVLFVVAYQGYQVARGIADSHPSTALANGTHIIHLEQSLGAFFEPAFQQAFLNHQWIIDLANWMYFNSHFVITTAFLVWLYMHRNDHFNFVRNMFLVAMGLALVGYMLYPTAPPRMFPTAGFTDTIQAFTSTN